MANCILCTKFDDCPFRSDPDAQCSGYKQRMMTNADRIRSMLDEELAEWFGNIQYDTAYYCAGEEQQKYPYPDGWLDWLREEADE